MAAAAAGGSGGPVNTAFLLDLNTGQRHELSIGRDVTIGSNKDVDIAIKGESAAGVFCVVQARDGGFLLSAAQQGSLSCSINDVELGEPTQLSQGCLVRVGRHGLFRFERKREERRPTSTVSSPLSPDWCVVVQPNLDSDLLEHLTTPDQVANLASSILSRQLLSLPDLQPTPQLVDTLFKALQEVSEVDQQVLVDFVREFYQETGQESSDGRGEAKGGETPAGRIPGHTCIIQLLVQLLRFSLDPIQHNILWLRLLAGLSTFTANLQALMECKASPAVQGAMAAHHCSAELQLYSCQVLGQLATYRPLPGEKAPVRQSVVELVVRAVDEHKGEERVVQAGCRVLAALVQTMSSTINFVVLAGLEYPEEDGSLSKTEAFVETGLAVLDFVQQVAMVTMKDVMSLYPHNTSVQQDGMCITTYFTPVTECHDTEQEVNAAEGEETQSNKPILKTRSRSNSKSEKRVSFAEDTKSATSESSSDSEEESDKDSVVALKETEDKKLESADKIVELEGESISETATTNSQASQKQPGDNPVPRKVEATHVDAKSSPQSSPSKHKKKAVKDRGRKKTVGKSNKDIPVQFYVKPKPEHLPEEKYNGHEDTQSETSFKTKKDATILLQQGTKNCISLNEARPTSLPLEEVVFSEETEHWNENGTVISPMGQGRRKWGTVKNPPLDLDIEESSLGGNYVELEAGDVGTMAADSEEPLENGEVILERPARRKWGSIKVPQPPMLESESPEMNGSITPKEEVSEETCVEKVHNGHNDFCDTLARRTRVVNFILDLWTKRKRRLQAADSLAKPALQLLTEAGYDEEEVSSLPEDERNSPLVVWDAAACCNVLDTLCANRSHWSLGVASRLLPQVEAVLKQQSSTRLAESALQTVQRVLVLVLDRLGTEMHPEKNGKSHMFVFIYHFPECFITVDRKICIVMFFRKVYKAYILFNLFRNIHVQFVQSECQ
ncbi:Hypp3175 [Branchiostoma lanceolatum]|uniref:Hypp3175 protein n=1 Tax=Branchiostoma lanceolatum TaxID=7740 RepID=A0A8K0ETF3_BRALA|nr:Hypp3175 [Branchiostoma lanceolatum]